MTRIPKVSAAAWAATAGLPTRGGGGEGVIGGGAGGGARGAAPGGGGGGAGGHRVVPKAHLCVRLRDGCWVLGRAVVPLASLAIGILPPDQVTGPLVLCLCSSILTYGYACYYSGYAYSILTHYYTYYLSSCCRIYFFVLFIFYSCLVPVFT